MPDALEEFKDRLKERVKGDIGELMPDAVVSEIITEVIKQEFLQERYENVGSGYHKETKRMPPLLWQYLKPDVERIAAQTIAKYFEEQPGAIEKLIEEHIGKNVHAFLANALASMFANNFEMFKIKLINDLKQNQQY